jgi:pimeloyl-ACP methyl ester carboxylesterase
LTTQRKTARIRPSAKRPAIGLDRARDDLRAPVAAPPTVSGRWLLAAIGIAIAGAAVCCWATLCLLFWQGSWQLLYHPDSAVARTPASLGLTFDRVAFAADEGGQTRLAGWWIPAGPQARLSRFTILYLHGQNGNLGNTVDDLAGLHAAGVNVLAFDYRGYGQSRFVRPNEAHWREDVEFALAYLAGTRQITADGILLDGEGLGADLALEIAAAHPELGGLILREPVPDAANAIFSDARARLVPAHLLVRDRYDLDAPAAALRIPSLWFYREAAPGKGPTESEPAAFQKVTGRKILVWLGTGQDAKSEVADAIARWIGDLPSASANPAHP